jgi:phosphoesterase RecJ-like protein
MYLTEAMRRESGCSGEDIEGLASHGRLIKGVDVALVLREEGDSVRVSLRSKGVVDVNLVAESLGGGGHRSAAGASVPGTLATVRERVLAVLSEQLR